MLIDFQNKTGEEAKACLSPIGPPIAPIQKCLTFNFFVNQFFLEKVTRLIQLFLNFGSIGPVNFFFEFYKKVGI